MAYNPNLHHRHSIRLKGYDYSLPGFYSVTICTFQKLLHFGTPIQPAGKSKTPHQLYALNEKGLLIQQQWLALTSRYTNIHLDVFSIMPDHIHGIIQVLALSSWAEQSPAPTTETVGLPKVGDIICAYKSTTTKLCNQMDNTRERKIWHRNYFERIIRDNTELENTRSYIQKNPINWKQDEHYLFYKTQDEHE